MKPIKTNKQTNDACKEHTTGMYLFQVVSLLLKYINLDLKLEFKVQILKSATPTLNSFRGCIRT